MQTSPISFSSCNKGNSRRLQAGNAHSLIDLATAFPGNEVVILRVENLKQALSKISYGFLYFSNLPIGPVHQV